MKQKKFNIRDWWFMAGMLIIILALATSCSNPEKEQAISKFKENINKIHTAIYTEKSLYDIYVNLGTINFDVTYSHSTLNQEGIIEDIFGDKSQTFIDQYKQTQSLYDDWYNKIGTLKKDISNYELWIKDADENNFYLSYIKARRFDTYGNKGWYEAYSTDMYQKIVIISEPEKIVINSIYPNSVYVEDAGQKEIIVEHTNAYRNWETNEYYNSYEAVDNLSNPYYLKDKLAEAIVHLAKNELQFTTTGAELRAQAETLDKILDEALKNQQ